MVWFLRRIGISVVLAWIVVTCVFLALHLVPGDPAEVLLSNDDGVPPSPAVVENLRIQLGLHLPLHEQYIVFLGKLVRFDLGRSMMDGYPVAAEILTRLPRTLELIIAATALSLLVGIPAGTHAGLNPARRFDRTMVGASALLQSVPIFVIGTLFILVFAQLLRWTPAGGYVAPQQNLLRHIMLLAMPAGAITLGFSIVIFRMTRSAVLDVMSRDYVRTARAKGVPHRLLVRRHIVRAAVTPVLTVAGMEMGTMLGGTMLTEFVFNWPGLSTPLLQAIGSRDYPMVSGIVLVISLLFLLINLITDLLYAVVDPRVRLT